MKRSIQLILRTFGACFSWIGLLSKGLRWMRNQLYTGRYAKQFAHFGVHSTLQYRCMNVIGLNHISIGEYTVIEPNIQLTAWVAGHDTSSTIITIGNHCTIRAHAHITAINNITIGDGLLTGTNVLITDNAHGEFTTEQLQLPPCERPIYSKGPVVIGNNVWLGNNVCVMPGVTIGDGAVIGANSVVTKNIPPYSMAAGVPASIIKQLEQ
jgi:acetyltransferase-like isoleucine patch superfamily enzyme